MSNTSALRFSSSNNASEVTMVSSNQESLKSNGLFISSFFIDWQRKKLKNINKYMMQSPVIVTFMNCIKNSTSTLQTLVDKLHSVSSPIFTSCYNIFINFICYKVHLTKLFLVFQNKDLLNRISHLTVSTYLTIDFIYIYILLSNSNNIK